MRFVAVFMQNQSPIGLGFDSVVEAVDFLFWGYEDRDLIPQGIYDKHTDQVTPYTHAGKLARQFEEVSIRVVAQEYLKRFQPLHALVHPDVVEMNQKIDRQPVRESNQHYS